MSSTVIGDLARTLPTLPNFAEVFFPAEMEGSLVGGLTGNAARRLFCAAGATAASSSDEDCFGSSSDEFCEGNQLDTGSTTGKD